MPMRCFCKYMYFPFLGLSNILVYVFIYTIYQPETKEHVALKRAVLQEKKYYSSNECPISLNNLMSTE